MVASSTHNTPQEQPNALPRISGSEAVIRSFLAEGVDTIFGYPGGAIIPVYDALYDYRDKINHILVRHEQCALHAAQGYARASGRTGVCIVTSGPGATNTVTGLADALLDSTPIVLISGQVGSKLLGTDAFQEINFLEITQSVTKWNCQVKRAEDIPAAIAKAFYIASSGRPGPVVVDITKDAQAGMVDFDYKPVNFIRSYQPYADIDEVKVDLSKLDVAKLCPIDRWLVIRTNQFIADATKYMDDYSTREVVVAFEAFVNDISNFYIRVNRARFWASANAEDKQNAYSVLFYAIKTIAQAMAPIVPFITETTWQRFIKRYSNEDAVSIFLTEYPTVSPAFDVKDDAILSDVEKAREIISLGLKLRNEKQIKIRQPLPTIYVAANA